MFPRVQLTVFHHWFRSWLGTGWTTSHYLNQWWIVYWLIHASLSLNELTCVGKFFGFHIDNLDKILTALVAVCQRHAATKAVKILTCLCDKLRTTHWITTKFGSYIPLVMLLTRLIFFKEFCNKVFLGWIFFFNFNILGMDSVWLRKYTWQGGVLKQWDFCFALFSDCFQIWQVPEPAAEVPDKFQRDLTNFNSLDYFFLSKNNTKTQIFMLSLHDTCNSGWKALIWVS